MCNKNMDKKTLFYSKNWKRLNPNISIRLYDNKMCEQFLLNEFSPLHRDIFNFIKHGPIKADFWRVCILYKYGGIYSDIDNEPLVPLAEFIDPSVDFVTCSSFSKRFIFNPNLILCNKENPIIKKCIDWYVEKYINKYPYEYWNWSIMNVFSSIIHINNYNREEGIYNYNNMKIQIIKEVKGKLHNDDHNVYKNKKVFNNRYKDWNFNTHSFDDNSTFNNRSIPRHTLTTTLTTTQSRTQTPTPKPTLTPTLTPTPKPISRLTLRPSQTLTSTPIPSPSLKQKFTSPSRIQTMSFCNVGNLDKHYMKLK
jgi:hypothetical protein